MIVTLQRRTALQASDTGFRKTFFAWHSNGSLYLRRCVPEDNLEKQCIIFDHTAPWNPLWFVFNSGFTHYITKEKRRHLMLPLYIILNCGVYDYSNNRTHMRLIRILWNNEWIQYLFNKNNISIINHNTSKYFFGRVFKSFFYFFFRINSFL